MSPTRLAVVCDYPEEGWPSMDLTAEMVLSHLAAEQSERVAATRICPTFRHRLVRFPLVGSKGAAKNADRLINRYHDYPKALGKIARRGEFDLYHLVDHSYSQLLHVLPRGRTVVTCHDLDTFRCILEPDLEPRPAWFLAFVRRTLDGFRKATAVACNSEATRDAILKYALIDPSRLHVVYMGRHPECSEHADPVADAEAARLLGPADPSRPPDLLHVGSTIPRKRIDVLLDVFAEVRRQVPGARLIRVGGPLTSSQEEQARALGIRDAIVTLPFCSRATLAAVYRRASLVLMPTEAEGFGLPAAEALACGTTLLASDLPILHEVAGDAAVYRPVADIPAWTAAAVELLAEARSSAPPYLRRRAEGLSFCRRYDWSRHAAQLVEIYEKVLNEAEAEADAPASAPGPGR